MASPASSTGRDLLRRYYTAFNACDGAAMAACYTDRARFSDPVYPDLRGAEVGDMWRMLTGRAQDLSVEVESLDADDRSGRATFTASYAFGPKRRQVRNRITSTFRLDGGRIAEQHDEFDLHLWATMAVGPSGRLLGWTPWFRARVRREAADALRAYRSRGAGASGS